MASTNVWKQDWFESCLSFSEEKKKLIRDFDEKQQEANETVRTDGKVLFLLIPGVHLLQK